MERSQLSEKGKGTRGNRRGAVRRRRRQQREDQEEAAEKSLVVKILRASPLEELKEKKKITGEDGEKVSGRRPTSGQQVKSFENSHRGGDLCEADESRGRRSEKKSVQMRNK